MLINYLLNNRSHCWGVPDLYVEVHLSHLNGLLQLPTVFPVVCKYKFEVSLACGCPVSPLDIITTVNCKLTLKCNELTDQKLYTGRTLINRNCITIQRLMWKFNPLRDPQMTNSTWRWIQQSILGTWFANCDVIGHNVIWGKDYQLS